MARISALITFLLALPVVLSFAAEPEHQQLRVTNAGDESPLDGERFTYVIRYDDSQFPRPRLQLEDVIRDR